jgi:hypothetical protein
VGAAGEGVDLLGGVGMKKRTRGIKEKLWTTKRDARTRGIAWQIKDADALELFTLPCDWCGSEPQPFNGIDRRNNEKYYRKSNALPCCWDCNRMKRTLTEKQWQRFCECVFMKYYADQGPIDYAAVVDAAAEAEAAAFDEHMMRSAKALQDV